MRDRFRGSTTTRASASGVSLARSKDKGATFTDDGGRFASLLKTSGLLTEEMIAARSKSRGVSEQAYMRGNLLGREVAVEDVAQAA